MAQISRKYPGKSADEIFAKVDAIMEGIARKMSLDYKKNVADKSGSVAKMGVSGAYQVRQDQVTIDLAFPIFVPGAMRQQVQEDIERRLDGLFA